MRSIGALWNSPTLTTWSSLAVRLSSAVIVLPLLLRKFDPEDILCWQIVASITALVQIVDFGMAPTFTRLIAYERGDTADFDEKKPTPAFLAILQTQRWLYTRLSLLTVLLVASLGTWGVYHAFNHASFPIQMWAVWGAVILASAMQIWSGAYGSTLQGINRIAQLRRTETMVGLVQIALVTLVILLVENISLVILLNQAFIAIGAFCIMKLLHRLSPQMSVPARRHEAVMSDLWPATWRSGIGVLMSQGIINLSGIVYSHLAPASQLVSYLFAQRITAIVSQFSQAPFYTKIPDLAKLYRSRDEVAMCNLATGGMRKSLFVYMIPMVGMAFSGDMLLKLIGANVSFVPAQTWWFLSIGFYFERLSSMYIQYYSSTNRIIWHLSNGATGCAMILLSVVFFPSLNIDAFPLALLVSYLLVNTVIGVAVVEKNFALGWRRHVAMWGGLPMAGLILAYTFVTFGMNHGHQQ